MFPLEVAKRVLAGINHRRRRPCDAHALRRTRLLLAQALLVGLGFPDICLSAAVKKDHAPLQTYQQSPGGLVELPPAQLFGQNQINNSGFERGSAGWKLGPCWSVDEHAAYEGSHSLRFDAGSTCWSLPAAFSVPGTRHSSRSYTLRAWVKASADSDLQVRLAVHDENDRTFILGGTETVTPGVDWRVLEKKDIDLLAIHDRHVLQVWAVVQGTRGTAWFDDVELIEQTPLPLSVFLLYPNFRGYLWASSPQTIRLQANVAVSNLATAKVRVLLKNEAGATIRTVDRPAKDSQVLELDGSSLSLGSYFLDAELLDIGTGELLAAYPPLHVVKVNDHFRDGLVNYIAPDNFLVHNGKKRFVWGVYDRFSARFRCRECLFRSAAAYQHIPGFNGLNTIDNYADTLSNAEINILPFAGVKVRPSDDQLRPWLEALDSKGIGHLQIVNNWVEGNRARPPWAREVPDQDLWHLLAAIMRDQRGAIGYYTYDEPRPDKIPIVFAQYLALRRDDPGSVTYGVLANVKQVFRWRDVSDAVGCDPYPLVNIPDADDVAYGATSMPVMMRVSNSTRETVRQVYGSRPVWVVAQLFRFAGRFPDYEAMKMQAYKAIINGATGILWWGFVSEKGVETEWYKLNNPQAYVDFKRISQEVMALEPTLISQPRPDLLKSVSNPNIEFLVKTGSQATQTIVFASNLSEEPIGDVTFSLFPSTPQSTVTVYAEGRALPIHGGMFADRFNGYDVHVYVIQ